MHFDPNKIKELVNVFPLIGGHANRVKIIKITNPTFGEMNMPHGVLNLQS